SGSCYLFTNAFWSLSGFQHMVGQELIMIPICLSNVVLLLGGRLVSVPPDVVGCFPSGVT
ncbi:MAG: hypothetical protein ACLQU1_23470, partial [Bryobacteraceae bacterium]